MRTQYRFSAILLAGVLLVLFPMDTWLGTLASSLAVQVSMALGVITLLCMWKRRWLIAATSTLAAGLILITLPSYKAPDMSRTPEGTELKVAHFNVLVSNKGYDSIIKAVKKENPDVVSFQEVTPAWAHALTDKLKADYPYSYVMPDEWVWGLALFSKTPLIDARNITMQGIPNIAASVCVNGQEVALLASHASNPVFLAVGRRNRHLRDISSYMAGISGPKLALGDYNTVPWDNNLKNLCRFGGLRDGRRSLSATYPTDKPYARIPIDYILHSDEWFCRDFRVIDGLSSDHLGIVGEYVLK